MKNTIATLLILITFSSCTNKNDNSQILTARIDSLENSIANNYKPQLGYFMTYIQIHHAKLWYAGKNKNWKLADFEFKEIQETFGEIKKFNTDRSEIKYLTMMDPVMTNLGNAIANNDEKAFGPSFTMLTNTCNACHNVAKYEFNVIKIPDAPLFTNQDFKLK